MSKFLDHAKQLLYLILLCMLVSLAFFDFDSLKSATQDLLKKAGTVESVAIGITKVEFGPERLAVTFSELFGDVPKEKQRRALELIKELDKEEFIRLMYVGQIKDLCEYEAPADPRMMRDVASDYRLAEKKIATMTDNAELLRRKMRDASREIAERGRAENGRPLRCYDMQLTEDGNNVKTALVGNFAEILKKLLPPDTTPEQQIASR